MKIKVERNQTEFQLNKVKSHYSNGTMLHYAILTQYTAREKQDNKNGANTFLQCLHFSQPNKRKIYIFKEIDDREWLFVCKLDICQGPFGLPKYTKSINISPHKLGPQADDYLVDSTTIFKPCILTVLDCWNEAHQAVNNFSEDLEKCHQLRNRCNYQRSS